MQLTAYGKLFCLLLPFIRKTLSRMKLIALLLTTFCMLFTATLHSQDITLSVKNVSLQEALNAIEKQTDYRFVYVKEQIEKAGLVTMDVKQVRLEIALLQCFEGQPLSYVIEDRLVIVRKKEQTKDQPVLHDVKGRVTNKEGTPLAGITVRVKGKDIATATDGNGEFNLKGISPTDILLFSGAEVETVEVSVQGKGYLTLTLHEKLSVLDQVLVMAYGETTKRLNTGNISKITAEEISSQPVSNPLAALQGRVPGMVVTQTSGVPGSSFKVEIRGRSSLDLSLSRNDPLFVIDGVPFEPGILASNQLLSAANTPFETETGGLSPLNTINPQDIESIEVLKDADATAIYGSRGANGVILITTKKGKPGRTGLNINIYQGVSKTSRTMDMLSTEQYLNMRREAFKNDGVTPQVDVPFTPGYAPDLLLWDTTRYTDIKKLLIGGTAKITNAQISLTGGSNSTTFLIAGGLHRESNVFSEDLHQTRHSVNFHVSHKTADSKLNFQLSGFYSGTNNQLVQNDMTQYIGLPPHTKLRDAQENINWEEGGINIAYIENHTNPLALLLRKYKSVSGNLTGNFQLSYKPIKDLIFRASLGYNSFTSDEHSQTPKSSINPLSAAMASAGFGNTLSQNWNIEPQVEYVKKIKKGILTILAGISWQERIGKSLFINASNYNSDLLLNSINAAGELYSTNNYSKYRYNATFGRMNYNFAEKYILNFSARRDGSSRFGNNKRFASFGALGAAWLFYKESFLQKLPFLSFGKLRGSYGITGNDQIGDYKYLDLWGSTNNPYQGIPGLQPSNLFNPNYSWEINRKLEWAIELGFLKDRFLLSAVRYRNRSRNQLINYKLPYQTGFSSIIQNFPALVENIGWEMLFSIKIVDNKRFSFLTSMNITFPKNKLISFPGIATSSYASFYKEGESLNSYWGYKFQGVNLQTGIYEFADLDKDGNPLGPGDYQLLGNTDPKYYGGILSIFKYNRFECNIFFAFRKQVGKNYLSYSGNNQPGFPFNQSTLILGRWKNPGDRSTIQKFTSSFGSDASLIAGYISRSDAVYTDASFLKLRNVQLAYSINWKFLKKEQTIKTRIYVQAQNLFSITKYKGSDPEIQNIYVLPPLRTIVAGININL